ncbi:DUF2344 domain-containing protein, partial [Candidatus Peregrinibacteria bacterium]|nr:DUF2344 domain-containing protein [Candidatus Peregrinibacteria bacterium]
LHYLHARSEEEELPWDHISSDISKRYYLKEWHRAIANRTTPDCLTESCSVCGACNYDSVRNVLFDRKRTETRLNIVDPPWEKPISLRESRNETPAALPFSDLDKPEFGSGSLDYIPADSDIDYPFQTPLKPVLIHDNEGQASTKIEFDRTNPLNRPQQSITNRIRIRYAKRGRFKFVGHLELSSILFRAMRRAGIPLAFSQGFSPKPRLIFGPPLQLGIESEWEYVDCFLIQPVTPSNIIEKLNSNLPEGFIFLEATEVPLKAKSLQELIEVQSYKAELNPWVEERKMSINPISFTDRVFIREKSKSSYVKNKKEDKKIRLSEALASFSIKGDSLEFELVTKNSIASLKPNEVIECLTKNDIEEFAISKIGVELNKE